MALTPNVASGATITSAWGNEIRDRTVQVFTSAAARTSAWAAPPDGAMSYLQDVDSVEFYNGTAWRPVEQIVAGTALIGTIPTGTRLKTIAGTIVVTSDVSSGLTFTIPGGGFTSGILTSQVVIGDSGGFVVPYLPGSTLTVWTGTVYTPSGGTAPSASVRLNYQFLGV